MSLFLQALWMTAAQIFVQELARARGTAVQDASSRARVEALERNVDRLSAALSNAVVRPILGMFPSHLNLELLLIIGADAMLYMPAR